MALQRFQDIRGECVYLRSDQGSNFMGARYEQIPTNESEDKDLTIERMKGGWTQEGKTWDLNPPKASHMGGVWERKIHAIQQCIDAYLHKKTTR